MSNDSSEWRVWQCAGSRGTPPFEPRGRPETARTLGGRPRRVKAASPALTSTSSAEDLHQPGPRRYAWAVIFGAAKMALSLFVSMIVLYVVFFVPVGHRTLWEYGRRIAGTPEAQEFGHEMQGAGERVIDKAQHEIHIPMPSFGDGGLSIPEAPAVPPHRVRVVR